MKNFKPYVFSFLVGLGVLSSFGSLAGAQGVNDFIINSFVSDYELTNEDPQGTLITIEKIDLDFSGQNHGILRAIPQRYGDQDTNPQVNYVRRDGRPEPYITYEDNDNLVLRVGDAGVFITGEHNYEISYTVENVITFYDDHDELYWDVNGDQWLQPFVAVEANLESPAKPKEPWTICYTGSFGSTDSYCEVATETNSSNIKTTGILLSYETLTFVSAFEKGYFTPLSWWEQNWKFFAGAVPILLQLAILRRAYRKWSKYGKDHKSRGIIVPYFGRPRNISVMQAAYVASNKLAPQHITAGIIDLAVRGYLKIKETNEKKPKHELELVKLPDDSLTKDEKLLLEELFEKVKIGSTIKIEDKKQKMWEALTKLRKLIDKQAKKEGFYEVTPRGVEKIFRLEFLLGIVAVFLGYISSIFIGPAGVVVGFVILGAVIILGILMTKRSIEGEELKGHMEGLNLYLKTAEKERLAAHDAVNAPLAPKNNEPVRDVKFFEKLLPFAIVYGVEKTWAKAFTDIYQDPPDWYNGNWNQFTVLALMNSIGSTNTATGSAFSPPSSSSGGSGFSGGGFSGGGGGGGGGGGW